MKAVASRFWRVFYLPPNTWAFNSTSALWAVGQSMATPYQVVYFAALGAPPFEIGLLVAYSTAVLIVTMIIGGYLSDTWSRKKLIMLFSWVNMLGLFIYILITSSIQIIVPLTLTASSNIYTPASQSIIMDEVEPRDRVRAFSVANAIGAMPGIFSPTIGGIFLSYLGTIRGMKTAYVCSCLFGFVALTIRSRMLKETSVRRLQEGKTIWNHVSDSIMAGIRAVRRSNPIVKRLLIYVALTGIGTGLTSSFVSIFVIDYLTISPAAYSVVVDTNGAVTVALYLGIVVLIRRLGARRSMLLASLASPVSNILLSQAKTANELLGWGLTGTLYTVLQSPSLSTMQAEIIPQKDRGKILAIFGILPNLAALPSQVLAGFLYANVSPVVPFLASIIPFAAAAIILFTIR
jgi:MFS family permease